MGAKDCWRFRADGVRGDIKDEGSLRARDGQRDTWDEGDGA